MKYRSYKAGNLHLKVIFICTLFFIYSFSTNAQIIKGIIKGPDSLPISGATIYVHELKIGTLANADGKFEIKVTPGNYIIEFRSLGYKSQKAIVNVTNNNVELNILLKEQTYSIPEAHIRKGNEDPAYAIMRKAIVLAAYNKNLVKSYKSSVYIKGSMNFLKIPKIVEKLIHSQGFPFKQGDVVLLESINEVDYNAPDKYIQRVISNHSTHPNILGNAPLGYVTTSFYDGHFGNIISPMSPKAFGFYTYKYCGFTNENGHDILKIAVAPKQKSLYMFSGYLYLVDKTYNIYSVDFSFEFEFGLSLIKQQYLNINDKLWLPVSHQFAMNMKGFGGKGEMYYSIIQKYSQVEQNNSITEPLLLSSENKINKISDTTIKSITKKSKEQIKVEKILQKGNLTTRDMIKLARIAKKEAENDTLKPSETLEVKSKIEYKIDSDANKKDTLYWSQNRPIALSMPELKSLNYHDSIVMAAKTDTSKSIVKRNRISSSDMITGGFWHDTSGNYSNFSGFISPSVIWFNPVDGFVYSFDGSVHRKLNNKNRLTFKPAIAYAFSRKTIYGKLYGEYNYAPLSLGNFNFETGKWSADYNGDAAVEKYVNTFSDLFFKQNYAKLYESKYFKCSNTIDLLNGLSIKFGFNYDNRESLSNHSNFSFFKPNKLYAINIPKNNDTLINIGHYINSELSLNISYTPFDRYQILRDGRKIYLYSNFPTIELLIRKGIPNMFASQSNFLFSSFTVHQQINWGLNSKFIYSVSSGKFFENSNIHFADYYQPLTQQCPVSLFTIENSFALLPYYVANTSKYIIEGHVNYSTSRFLLKYIPIIDLTNWNEELYVNYLHTDYYNSYSEFGYGISQLYLGTGSINAYAAFNNFKYSSWGIKIIIGFQK